MSRTEKLSFTMCRTDTTVVGADEPVTITGRKPSTPAFQSPARQLHSRGTMSKSRRTLTVKLDAKHDVNIENTGRSIYSWRYEVVEGRARVLLGSLPYEESTDAVVEHARKALALHLATNASGSAPTADHGWDGNKEITLLHNRCQQMADAHAETPPTLNDIMNVISACVAHPDALSAFVRLVGVTGVVTNKAG